MGQVMTSCLKSGKPLPTGVVMDRASFESATVDGNEVGCPHCGGSHVWSKANAWVED